MLEIIVDTDRAKRLLDDVGRRQIPFATSLAINRTADEALAAAKKTFRSKFAVREPRWADFMFRHVLRSTKNNLIAQIGVTGPKAHVITKHEKGGTFRAGDPFKPFFIPTRELRPARMAKIAKAMYPKALRIFERGAPSGTLPGKGFMSRGGKPMFKGKRRTFTLPTSSGRSIGIFQRIGRGRRNIRMLWAFRDRITLPPRLAFRDTAQRVVAERFDVNFDGFLAHALRTAR